MKNSPWERSVAWTRSIEFTLSELETSPPQLSALREISLAKELHDAGVPQTKHLYMGQALDLESSKPKTLTVVWCRLLHPQLSKDEV